MNPLISVIIPVYNVEIYLNKCIDSIINQTYRNIEVVLVDDGSTDQSCIICDECAKIDNRIKVIHKQNGGLSDARNQGLNIAKGEYIVFVDSDDWMESNGIEYMYKLSQKYNADLVIVGTQKISECTGKVIWSTFKENEEILAMNKYEAIKDTLINGCAAWGRLYKKEIHDGIHFPVGEINEDEAIVLRILERCNTIVKTSKVAYNYRFRENSITSTTFHIKKLAWCKHSKDNWDYIRKNYPDLEYIAKKRYVGSIIWALNNMTLDTKKFRKEIYLYRKKLRKYYREYISDKDISIKEKLRTFSLCNMYYIYAIFVKIFNKNYT